MEIELQDLFSETGATVHNNNPSVPKKAPIGKRKRGPYKKKKEEPPSREEPSILGQYSDYLNDKNAMGPPPPLHVNNNLNNDGFIVPDESQAVAAAEDAVSKSKAIRKENQIQKTTA